MVRDFIQEMDRVFRFVALGVPVVKPRYRSPRHFLLVEGRSWSDAPKPRDVRWGPKKSCYGNATNLALDDPQNYFYVEGYMAPGLGKLIVPHAWCVDRQGLVVDPTARPIGSAPREYWGVSFNNDFLLWVGTTQRFYGVFTGLIELGSPEHPTAWRRLQSESPEIWRARHAPDSPKWTNPKKG